MKIFRWYYLIGLCFILVSTVQARTYKIGVVPWAGWAPIHVADAKGFWKEQGIDVEIINYYDSTKILSDVRKKRIDIGFDMVGTIVGFYMRGVSLTVISETDWSHGGDKIIIKKGLHVLQFKGRPFGVYLNKPSVTYFLNKYLSTMGMRIADARVIQLDPERLANKFIAGLFNIIVLYDPYALHAAQKGNGEVIATSATYEGCIPEGMYMQTDALAQMPAQALEKIFKGWIKAVQWIKKPPNWREFKDILNSRTFKDDASYSDGELREMMNGVRIHEVSKQLERNRDGGGLHQYLKELNTFLIDNQKFEKEFKPEEIFNNKVIVKVLESIK